MICTDNPSRTGATRDSAQGRAAGALASRLQLTADVHTTTDSQAAGSAASPAAAGRRDIRGGG